MFEFKQVRVVSKEVIREYKNGELVSERTIVNDGGTSEEEAEKRLKEAEEKLDKMGGRMGGVMGDVDKLFKDLFG